MNTYSYVDGNPIIFLDQEGLANSGQTVNIGNKTTVRIDPPHVQGQQTHAHVCETGCKEIVVNQDGTGSHGTNPSKLTNRAKTFLRKKGFKLLWCPPFFFDILAWITAQQCAGGDLGACTLFKSMGGEIRGDSQL